MKPFVDSNHRFTVELFKKLLRENSGRNCLVSPICAQVTLTMILAGAAGKTADEIKAALHLFDSAGTATSTYGTLSGTQCGRSGGYYQWLKNLLALLNQHSKNKSLMLGGRIFASSNFNFMEAFEYCINDLCSAQVEKVDFRNQNEDARQKMNTWIGRQTGGKITNYFGNTSIDASTIMVLLNTVSFRGIWMTPFNPKDTVSGVFWTCKDQSINVDMMTRKGIFDIVTISNPPMQMLVLPFMNDILSMYIFLPDKHLSLDEILNNLTFEQLQQWISLENVRSIETTVLLPKFSMEVHNSLNTVFSNMGVQDLFISGKANLSGMTGNNGVSVSRIGQVIRLTITEEGGEAAGVSRTEIVDGTQSEFKVNRSFWCMLVHRPTACILFIGVVCKPKWDH